MLYQYISNIFVFNCDCNVSACCKVDTFCVWGGITNVFTVPV